MAFIEDGHPTLVTFSASTSAALYFKEKEVTPVGISAGGENDTTTMKNTTWRTKAPKQLKTLTTMSEVAMYDPAIYDEVVGFIGVNQQVTITFPDTSTLVFWGWIDEFTPNAVTEGTMATANVTIIASNQNDSQEETAPVYTAAA
jgi:hypothetical protein